MSPVPSFVLVTFMAAAASVLAATPSSADAGRWRVDIEADGAVASLQSTNSLSMGSNRMIEYHPSLLVSCSPGENGDWHEMLRLRESVDGRESVSVAVQLDGERKRETWILQESNSTLVYAGNDAVRRLAGHRKLRIGWRAGFFSEGEAVFSLNGIDAVLKQLADVCGPGE